MEIETNPHILEVWAFMQDLYADKAEKDALGANRECIKEDFLKKAKEYRTIAVALRNLI